MNRIAILTLGIVLGALPVVLVASWTGAAQARLQLAEASESGQQVAVASAANEEYCTPQLQRILRRVLQSCGLLSASGRGCQPVDARNVATMDDADFNALFVPMQDRGGIVQYERGQAELDSADVQLVDRAFADRRGASYFLVVARASPDGPVSVNRELSRQRAEVVLDHLQQKFHDPELQKQVGLLWLGEEYAQLDSSFCEWSRSGEEQCNGEQLNRSAFIAWIDCTL